MPIFQAAAPRISTFRAFQIRNADLTGASVADSRTDGMTIEGILVSDLIAAYRTVQGK